MDALPPLAENARVESVGKCHTLENIEAAQAIGIHSVHFQSTGQTIAALARLIG
jgi:hypothetical protein